jgi:hypothetical protein
MAYLNLTRIYTTVVSVVLFYNGTEAKFKEVFAEFLAIPAISTTLGPLSYNDVTKVLTSPSTTPPANTVRTCLLVSVVTHLFMSPSTIFPECGA